MSKQYFFMMLGAPGSGKSTFARQLARELSAIHFNSDAMRLAIFKSREATDRIYHSDNRSVLNSYTFGALNYASRSVLKVGLSVVYDANNNTKLERLDTVSQIQNQNMLTVVILVQIPREIAIQRAQARRESNEQRKLSMEDAEAYIIKITDEIELPEQDENLIKIDGTIPFEAQFESFKKQLAEIENE